MTDRATQLREAGRDVISLSVGEPDFATPDHVLAAAADALASGQTKYTPVTGTLRLKQAAALHFRRDLGIQTRPEQVIVTAGGKQAIFEALAATVGEGDEVLLDLHDDVVAVGAGVEAFFHALGRGLEQALFAVAEGGELEFAVAQGFIYF